MERIASDSLPPAPPLTAACGRPFFSRTKRPIWATRCRARGCRALAGMCESEQSADTAGVMGVGRPSCTLTTTSFFPLRPKTAVANSRAVTAKHAQRRAVRANPRQHGQGTRRTVARWRCLLFSDSRPFFPLPTEFRLSDELVHRHDRQHHGQHEHEHDRPHHDDQCGLQQRGEPA